MKVLIIGSGGREHALAWKAAQSSDVKHVYVAPGNAGTALEPLVENIDIAVDDITALLSFAADNNIDLTIVGPEIPLVLGIVDTFQQAGLRCFGPSKAAAQLEGSKSFTKDFLARHNIPTATYQTFTDYAAALEYLKKQAFPIVIKADGLAAGKGVIIAQNLQHATDAVKDMLAGNVFGEAGHRVVIEAFLHGEEASFIVIVDGENIVPLATSQDHKARDDGDTGPNTGGMGAYSPAPVITTAIHARVMEEVIIPTVAGMAKEGHPYVGFLYAGLMIAADGTPKVLEYNCRFGDPETQPIMMRMTTDLIALCNAALNGKLATMTTEWDSRAAVGVVMVAEGYPDNYLKGEEINGLPVPNNTPSASGTITKVFHAATRQVDAKIITNGGRVLCVVALGDNVRQAQSRAYELVDKIRWNNVYFRRDIGYRAIARETKQQ
ncbi:MAG: phosphoribosylamine--glycine ligase [Gammaproteobacteria bacterium]|nr:phosphoribosylamine--glycine ligase [Gammaproteobacteria bacterium]